MTPPAADPRTARILELERRRCAALIAADFATLDQLLAEDLIHVHGSGTPDTKAHYFEDIRTAFEFLAIERTDARVRFHGDVAVLTGPMMHRVRVRGSGEIVVMHAFGTQIWAPAGGSWKLMLYQATPIAKPA